ncbi:BatD family protein [uncultured Paraglaciecola sp.]|uniref:BatD family protein n=1 Tax=uncultured Paraglaciecola sp. TaxID=1765024 RepID=UPI0026230378|nr:BatD family protein [uncultured Paraglaciecola sp.]
MNNIPAILIYIALLVFTNMAQALEVSASVDKNPVMVDESFILTVSANGDVARDAFDPSFLMKDFVVGRTSISSQTKMVNFDTTRTTTWSTVLIPQKKGRFTIPAFDVDGAKTQSLEVLVIPASSSAATGGRDLFITTHVDVEKAYLQQQIRYTVKLHLGKDLQRGSLSSPTLANADIRQIGKDKEYNDIVEGRRYRIIERSFAIIAQQSGTFTIEGPLFEGEVIDNSRQSFGLFNRGKTVNRVGPSQSITVLPIPSNYSQHWLPSDFVQLDDEWQGNSAEYVAGEPITRTITLTAVGVVEEQLPEIISHYPDSVKTYPDQAETATVEKDATLIAQRKESIAIIPSEAGQLVVPEVRIPWFNTLTQKTEYAVLPEQTLSIVPATTTLPSAIPLPPRVETQQSAEEIAPLPASSNSSKQALPQYWLWLTFGLVILWLLTLLLWWKQVSLLKSAAKKANNSLVRTTQQEQQLWQSLEKSFHKNNLVDIQKYLPLWLGHYTQNNQASLAHSLKVIDELALTEEVESLLASRYGKNQYDWNSSKLQKILRGLRKNGRIEGSPEHHLRSMYPTS